MDLDSVIVLVCLGVIVISLAFVVIGACTASCDDSVWEDGPPTNEAAAAAVHRRPGVRKTLLLLDKVTYARRNALPASTGGGGGGGLPTTASTTAGTMAAAAADCAICLGQFEDGDRCSVMPICHHEFHRDCIANWLTARKRSNTCPLCRAKLQWSLVAQDMV